MANYNFNLILFFSIIKSGKYISGLTMGLCKFTYCLSKHPTEQNAGNFSLTGLLNFLQQRFIEHS